MHMRKLGLFLGGATLAAAVSALSGCSNVQQHHVMVLNAELALKGAKLPVYTQIQAEFGKAKFNDEYGIDKKSYAVWPSNVSPQQGAVQADLDRQRNNLLNAAKLEGQLSLEKAATRRAQVDKKYADFIRTLTPAQQTYLRTLDMSNAIKQHQRPESTEKIEFLLGAGQR